MKTYQSGLDYIRRVAISAGLIGEADNNDMLVQRVAEVIKAAEPKTVAHIAKTIVAVGMTEYDTPEPEPEPEPKAKGSSSGGFSSN